MKEQDLTEHNIQVGKCSGELNRFIIEPFVVHEQEDEYYVCIFSTKDGDTIYFYEQVRNLILQMFTYIT